MFAAFYTFRTANFDGAIALAEEALKNEHLATNHKARANHVKGLSYTYKFQDSQQLGDLNEAIAALNDAIGLDPGMTEVRSLLKELRAKKASMPSS